MAIAKITAHPAFPIGEISKRLYSGYMEPFGDTVYGSIYNPSHKTADELGFRRDYIEQIRESGMPAARLPGGNLVSGWRWKDSIGPISERKAHVDLAWFQDLPVGLGHDEYLRWMEKVNSEPLYTINLGTGGIEDAIDLVEYSNLEGGTYWSDLRRKNGHEAPYGVKVWYLGNEVDGPWQIGSFDRHPKEYGFKANEISKVLKWTDPTIETAACVSSTPYIYHYPKWDVEALEECYESVDYISMHHYHLAPPGDLTALLGGTEYFEDYIRTEEGVCDYVQTLMRSPRKMMFSFDEFAMVQRPTAQLHPGGGIHNQYDMNYRFKRERGFMKNDVDHVNGGMGFFGDNVVSAIANTLPLLTFMNHADRIGIACMTGSLMALCGVDNDHVWTPVGYYPYTQLMRWGQGVAMKTQVTSETYEIPAYESDDISANPRKEAVPYLVASTAYNEKAGELTVFAVNRNPLERMSVELDLSGFEGYEFKEHIELYSDEINLKNTYENPNAVVPKINPATKGEGGKVSAQLQSLSWNVFRFVKKA